MRPIQLGLLFTVNFLVIAGSNVWADDVRKTDNVPAQPAATTPQGGVQGVGPIVVGPGQLQGQITVTATAQAAPAAMPIGPAAVTIDADGVKHVQSEQYAKKVSITDDPQKGIKIEHTFKKGGTDETKSYQAKDAKELEKKYPEGFKLYQQYLGNQAGAGMAVLQIQGAVVPAGPGVPAPFPMPGAQGGIQLGQAQIIVNPAASGLPIEAATDALANLRRDIKSAAAGGSWKDAPLESRVALKKQAAAMRKQLQELENQLEGK
jgi:hypothetical protein